MWLLGGHFGVNFCLPRRNSSPHSDSLVGTVVCIFGSQEGIVACIFAGCILPTRRAVEHTFWLLRGHFSFAFLPPKGAGKCLCLQALKQTLSSPEMELQHVFLPPIQALQRAFLPPNWTVVFCKPRKHCGSHLGSLVGTVVRIFASQGGIQHVFFYPTVQLYFANYEGNILAPQLELQPVFLPLKRALQLAFLPPNRTVVFCKPRENSCTYFCSTRHFSQCMFWLLNGQQGMHFSL